MNKKPLHILFILVGLTLAACSAERNNPLSKTYHNTTARYNGYFLAKEKMRLLEEKQEEQMVYDYSQVLPIYPILDSTTANAAAADLEDIKKKASFPIQYHQNSKWVDNSYNLIGKASFYELKFEEAVRTFKYVNANSKDADDKHEALVWLMRSFMQLDEMENAKQVSEYLRKERLNRDNARELYLARAHYYTLEGDTAQVIENLALSIPNFEDKDAQSKVRYTLAQLYQLTNQDKEASKQYAKILRRNPPYDLGFFSRLNLGQVSELADKDDRERIEGYYRKLLKDDKNKEYRNKIYYEMAQFELRQQHYDKALEYLNQSLRTPGSLPNQSAYSYVSAGEIYFDNLQKYNLAAAYYDSAVQVYPKTAAMYEAVAERRDILADFARQYTTIQTQDSLQRLAKMPEAERMAFLQQLVQLEEEARLAEQERQQQLVQEERKQAPRQNRNSNSNDLLANNGTGGVWYFDNPTAMATARAEFTRRWGDRPNQDFWRIRTRGENQNQTNVVAATTPAAEPAAAAAPEQTPEERLQAQVDLYLQDIPLTTVAFLRSEKLEEDALFRLGGIYAQSLKAPNDAISTYEQLLERFPLTEHAPETYYSLYLLYGRTGNTEQQQVYFNKIKDKFPGTVYARLIEDSDFMKKNASTNLLVHALYDSAYTHYDAREYRQTLSLLNRITSQYPLNDIQDKVAFLDAMVAANTEKPTVLFDKLTRFKNQHKGSPLVKQADQLLITYQELERRNQLRTDAPETPAPAPKKTDKRTPEEKVSTKIATAKTAAPTATVPAADTKAKVPATPAAKPAVAAAEQGQQQQLPAVPTASTPADSATVPAVVAAAVPAVDPMAYEAGADSAYFFVLIYPTEAKAFEDIQQKYAKYNNTYYKKQNLAVDSVAYGNGKTMLVMRAFEDPALATSYNIKQKGPQAPVGRIRGVDFTTFVISSANYQKFLQKKDLEAYLTFFKNNY
ncbi:tetratricopeptide repeat protein [Pontibacter akesuensis]|uniref:type IX secretion system periplasmic lipoprotein PorW/SprE n=1 Tax=Pontibacter akesuensis TaxID=388950 RepID=UPI00083B5D4E|nr:tetratricopeptide repeat protein [Pontibacter akesuensis]